MKLHMNTLGIDIGSTTVKIALLNKDGEIIFSDYRTALCQHPGNSCCYY